MLDSPPFFSPYTYALEIKSDSLHDLFQRKQAKNYDDDSIECEDIINEDGVTIFEKHSHNGTQLCQVSLTCLKLRLVMFRSVFFNVSAQSVSPSWSS